MGFYMPHGNMDLVTGTTMNAFSMIVQNNH